MKETHCLFNLLVYLRESDRIPYYIRLIKNIKEKFACHVIFILPEKLTLELKDQEHCVLLYVKTAQVEHLTLDLFSHLLSDIPIYLLWGQDPLEETAILNQLQHFSHRLIFDSDPSNDLPALSSYLKGILQKHPLDIVDLNWIRICGWREVLLKVFDTPDKIEQLRKTAHIVIHYNASMTTQEKTLYPNPQHSYRGGYYLQLWLASRFAWKLQSEEEKEMEYSFIYKEATVVLKGQSYPHLFPSCITRIEFSSNEGEKIILHRQPNNFKKVRVEAFDKEKCHVPYSFYIPIYYEGPNFLSDLLFSATSPHYLQSLEKL